MLKTSQSLKILGRLFRPLKPLLPRNLLWRGLLIIAIPLLLTQAIAVWAFYDRHFEVVTKRLTTALSGEIVMLVDLLERAENSVEEALRIKAAREHFGFESQFTDKPLPSVNRTAKSRGRPSLLESLLIGQLPYDYDRIHIEERLVPNELLVLIKIDERVLEILINRKRLFSDTLYIVIAWFFAASFISFGVATIFLKNQIRPIRKLAAAAEAIGKGKSDPFFKPEGASEVRLAGRTFIAMRTRIRQQIARRTTLLAGVSHDLRTPLTRMRLSVEMINDDPETKETLLDDIQKMQKMIEGYLNFVRGNEEEPLSKLDLCVLAKELANNMNHRGQITLNLPSQTCLVDARKNGLYRALQNLIDNALNYTRDQVHLSLEKTPNNYKIHIDDNGPGIDQSQLEQAFKPFMRLDMARGADTGGVGLGLTITRELITDQGGSVKLSRSHLGGLRATILLVR